MTPPPGLRGAVEAITSAKQGVSEPLTLATAGKQWFVVSANGFPFSCLRQMISTHEVALKIEYRRPSLSLLVTSPQQKLFDENVKCCMQELDYAIKQKLFDENVKCRTQEREYAIKQQLFNENVKCRTQELDYAIKQNKMGDESVKCRTQDLDYAIKQKQNVR